MIEHILINMKFTDKSHDTLESITVNLKDYFAEYGYIPRTEAIPIEWIKNYAKRKASKGFTEIDCYWQYWEEDVLKMVADWEKENDKDSE